MIKCWQMLLVALATVVPRLATAQGRAGCVDIKDEHAVQLIAGRP